MTHFRMNHGWLVYDGDIGLVAANVLDAEMSALTSTVDVTSWHSPFRKMVPGPTEIKFTAQLDAKKMRWDRDPRGGEAPNLAALLALARRHPDEYDELREGEEILKALGG